MKIKATVVFCVIRVNFAGSPPPCVESKFVFVASDRTVHHLDLRIDCARELAI
jgi:hypothetical protein